MKVTFYATLRQYVGAKTIEMAVHEDATVQNLLDEIIARYPVLRQELLDENNQLFQHVNLFVNSRNALFLEQGMQTRLPGDAVIGIFPAVGGG